uniref:TPR_REGION domain-containing protein n=1 Tax=Onchocerca volvulus TaxID=6282 RepID=A0A8R1XV39_ONCVO
MSDDEEENGNNNRSDSTNSMNIGVKNKFITLENDLGQDNVERNGDTVPKVASGKIVAKTKKRELHGFDRRNFILHHHFIRRDFNACKALIKEMADECGELCEYPFFTRGKIARIEGNFREALTWFGKAQSVNPSNAVYTREIGCLHFLLGNHIKASEKSYYWRAMALYHIKQDSESALKAQECLLAAPSAARHVEILTFLARLCEQRNDIKLAIDAQKKALELEPENLEILTNLGLLYTRWQNDDQAFDAFGRALSCDPTHPQGILAAGSIIQKSGEHDVALTKYRIAAEKCEYNGPLWNNIGMCFFGKSKCVAAISCLKRANYLCPLEWKICYNLGIVHNAMQQYASAYHFLSSAVNLNTRSMMPYMALAVVLTNLDDILNANKAYDRALQLDKNDSAQIRLNYAIFKARQKEFKESAVSLQAFYKAITNKQQLSQAMLFVADNLKRYLSQLNKFDEAAHERTVP